MNHRAKDRAGHRANLRAAACAAWLAATVAASPAWASPGAHGPNGEHLDAPNGAAQASGPVPRMEARSDDFELVARLAGGEFTMMINRYATGEPVLGARIEVESGPRKLALPFHDDMGDYATDDAALLKLLATPGSHPVVITIVAGADSDLLEGTLTVTAEAAKAFVPGGHDHDHDHGAEHTDDHDHGWRAWARKPLTWALVAAGLMGAVWGAGRLRKRQSQSQSQPVNHPVGGV